MNGAKKISLLRVSPLNFSALSLSGLSLSGLSLSGLSLAILMLTGCDSTNPADSPDRTPWTTEVSRKSLVETISYGKGQGVLPAKDHRKIKDLIANSALDAPVYARLLLNVPETKSKDSLTVERVKDLKRHLKSWGIPETRVSVHYVSAQKAVVMNLKHQHSISVVIDQFDVKAPQCPGWDSMGDVILPQGEQQFGCVTERNFAHMVAEPRDLYEAQAMGNRDGAYNAKAMGTYRGTGKDASKGSDAGSMATGAAALGGMGGALGAE